MITNEIFAKLFDKLQVTERHSTISVQSPVRNEYKPEIFWNKVIRKEPVIMHNTKIIAAATKNMIAGIFYEGDRAQIMNLALKLAFYVMDGDDASFVYKNVLTFVNLNQPEPLLGSLNRRKVSLVSNGWFEKWNNVKNPPEIYQYLRDSTNDECVSYWGPWLATTILNLRFDNRTAEEVAKSIDNVFSKLCSLYQGLDFIFPKVDIPFWEQCLKRIRITINLDEHKKNSLYWAAINVFHSVVTPKTTIDLLNLTIIPFLRFKNMELIELIDKFRTLVGCSQCGALLSSLCSGTLRSWESYIQMTETYLNPKHPMGKDKFWPYAREFDSTVFVDMSYPENFMICNILAVMIDWSSDSWYNYEGPGPMYKRLTYMHYNCRLNKMEFEHCLKVYNLMRKKVHQVTTNVDSTIPTNKLTL